MEKLTNKRSFSYDYPSRYTGVPAYFDSASGRDVYGIGKQIRFDTSYFSHKLKPDETLDSLALHYYQNPTYWWAIAYFNCINDPFIRLIDKFTVIKIPNLAGIIFED